jgi:sec-independent protein translocase protein TatB
MFGIGMPELAVIIVVALVVLGPKRLPEVARSLGKGLAEFRRLTGDVNKELEAARHMIESEARDHEKERRKTDRESRETTAKASLTPDPDGSDSPTTDATESATDAPVTAEPVAGPSIARPASPTGVSRESNPPADKESEG